MTIRYQGTHGHHASVITGPGFGSESTEGVVSLVKNFVNNEGSDLDGGDVVKLDLSGDLFVEKTEDLEDPLFIGVVFGTGPYADGDPVPVVVMGFCEAVAVTGSVSRGDYICPSATDGVAETQSTPGTGAMGRALTDDSGGFIQAIIFESELGGGGGGSTITETGGPTVLDAAAIPDFTFFRREGTDFLGRRVVYANQYHPDLAPNSPHADNDEFDDLSLAGAYTQVNGGSATHTVDETILDGFVLLSNTDGGAGSDTGIYKAYTPGANAFTMVVKIFGNVRNAGSNQNNLQLFDGSGNFIYGVGKLNGSQFIVNDSGGFRTYGSITYVAGDIGVVYLMISRDASTNYQAFVSQDGFQWHRLEGANRSGTVGRAKIVAVSFSSSNAQLYCDFLRFFTTQTFVIGGTP